MTQEISIYIHWPFCRFKCPYCDFNSHVRDKTDQLDFLNCYTKEIDYYSGVLQSKTIKSIFFGGGTPSLMEGFVVGSILNHLSKYATFSHNIEITLEANPTSVEIKKFQEYKSCGVNRVSIGVQSFNQENLIFLQRQHSADEAKTAIKYAAKYFDRFSFDMMYAIDGQTPKSWKAELKEAIKFGAHHMSLYQLTIEKGTQFYKDFISNRLSSIDDNTAADLYELTQEIMESNGLNAYEISNHSYEGHQSIHNLNYWRYGDYIGIGAGAHGRYTVDDQKYYTVNFHQPEKWSSQILNNGSAMQSKTLITTTQIRREMLMVGMRLNEGVNLDLIDNKIKLQSLVDQGYLIVSQENIVTTRKGKLVLNTLLNELLN